MTIWIAQQDDGGGGGKIIFGLIFFIIWILSSLASWMNKRTQEKLRRQRELMTERELVTLHGRGGDAETMQLPTVDGERPTWLPPPTAPQPRRTTPSRTAKLPPPPRLPKRPKDFRSKIPRDGRLDAPVVVPRPTRPASAPVFAAPRAVDRPAVESTGEATSRAKVLRSQLGPSRLKQQFLISEVLRPPVALRDE